MLKSDAMLCREHLPFDITTFSAGPTVANSIHEKNSSVQYIAVQYSTEHYSINLNLSWMRELKEEVPKPSSGARLRVVSHPRGLYNTIQCSTVDYSTVQYSSNIT